MQSVAVIGGSNGGYASAADFADREFDVGWYLRTPANHEAVLESGAVTLRVSEDYVGPLRSPGERRTVEVDRVTTHLGEAVAGRDAVVVPLPTTTQPAVLESLAGHLEPGQSVFFCPGNFGSYRCERALADRPDGPDPAEVTLAETPTLPYVTRRSEPSEVTINLDAVHLPVGAYPGEDTPEAYDALSTLYPEGAMAAENALDCALTNANALVNAVPTVLNAGAIECDEFEFNIHRHGIGDGVYNVLMAVDRERVRLREALGFGEPHFTQDHYYRPDETDGEHFYGKYAREALTSADTFSEDPPSLDDRYVHEDVAIATVFLASLGDYLEVDTPTTDAIVTVAERLMDEPYGETGRTLESLGLADLDRDAFERGLDRGFDRTGRDGGDRTARDGGDGP